MIPLPLVILFDCYYSLIHVFYLPITSYTISVYQAALIAIKNEYFFLKLSVYPHKECIEA